MVHRYGSDLKQAALAVCDQTDREDLRTMANMYSNNLDGEMKRAGRYVLLGRMSEVSSFCISQVWRVVRHLQHCLHKIS